MKTFHFSGWTDWAAVIRSHRILFFSEIRGVLVIRLFRPVVAVFSSVAFSCSINPTQAEGGKSAGSASNTRTKVRNPDFLTLRPTQDLPKNVRSGGWVQTQETNRYRQDLGY